MAEPTPLRPRRICPICKKPASQKDFPFCSGRCKAIDLGRWLGGSYAIPAAEAGQPGDETAAPEGE